MRTKIVNEKYYAETYNEDDIKELCSIGEIAPEDLDKFRGDLEDIAALYRWENAKHEKPTRTRDIKRELQDISKHANRLLSTLESISWQAQQKIDRRACDDGYKDRTDELSESDEPSLAISLADLESDIQCVIVDVPTLRSLLIHT